VSRCEASIPHTGKLGSGLALFGAIERLAVKDNVALRFQALADEIERRSAASRDQSSARPSLKA
jgi:hypothetical protein